VAVNESPRSREGQLAEKPLLATIGLVGGVLGLTAMVFGVGLYVLDPGAAPLAMLNLLFGVVGIVFYALTNRASLRQVASGRSAALIALEVLLVTGIVLGLVAVNWVASQSTKEWDFTKDKLYTLEEQSIQVAERLKEDVTVYGFFRPSDQNRAYLTTIVELYQRHSAHVKLELMNVDAMTPAQKKRFQLVENGPRIVVMMGERQAKVRGVNEEQMTNALVRVAESAPRVVRMLAGHDEAKMDDLTNDGGFGRAATAIQDLGYQAEPLNLTEAADVPDDLAVLVIAGPVKPLFANEVDAIGRYLDKGGRAVVMIDPGTESGLEPLLLKWGAKLGDDLVVDPNPAAKARGYGADAPLVSQLEPHPITNPLRGGAALMFWWVRSVAPAVQPGVGTVTTLALTGATSWAEVSFKTGGEVEKNDDDIPGPVPIAVAINKTTPGGKNPEARLVVIGDSSFATNRFYAIGGNSDFFANAVSWVMGDDEHIALRPKARGSTRVALTERELYGIVFFSVNLLPLCIMGFGFSVWAVRRRR